MKSFNVDMKKIECMTYKKLWTWADLSRNAGITQTTIFALKAKRRNASRRTLYKIANALGVEPSDIVSKD